MALTLNVLRYLLSVYWAVCIFKNCAAWFPNCPDRQIAHNNATSRFVRRWHIRSSISWQLCILH